MLLPFSKSFSERSRRLKRRSPQSRYLTTLSLCAPFSRRKLEGLFAAVLTLFLGALDAEAGAEGALVRVAVVVFITILKTNKKDNGRIKKRRKLNQNGKLVEV